MTEKMTNKRVVITGMGSICGLGHNLSQVWEGLLEGRSGVSTIESFSLGELPVSIAGEVKNFSLHEQLLAPKDIAKYDRFIHFALQAAYESLENAGLLKNFEIKSPYLPHKMGCLLGVGMGGFPIIESTAKAYYERGIRRVSPFFIPAIIPNMAPGLISIRFGLQGINYNVTSACASAAHAISAAAFEILSGRQDLMITGGAESVMCSVPFAGFSNMKALSKRNEEPSKASRPFDLDRDGFVMGEGAGILILEDLEKAKSRGAKIYAEIIGHGASSDAYHTTAPHPEGQGAILCMNSALESAQIPYNAIDYINAHGTSTPLGDIAETKAIKAVFKDHSQKLLVSSTKSMTGHLLGAAGGLETIVCAMALNQGIIPPTLNLENPDPECDLDYVPLKARKKEIEYALNNSFGFGGTNSCLILKRYNES